MMSKKFNRGYVHENSFQPGYDKGGVFTGSSKTSTNTKFDNGWQGKGTGHMQHVVKSCTHYPKAVKVGNTVIYACRRSLLSASIQEQFDVISPLVTGAGNDFDQYTGFNLWFPIQDYKAPPAHRLRLHAERLVTFARQGAKVLTFCEGSHGRTGTVIAACIAFAEPELEDPVAAVRERHCHHAVETDDQIAVVFRAFDRQLPDKYKKTTFSSRAAFSPSMQAGLNSLGFPASEIVDLTSDDGPTAKDDAAAANDPSLPKLPLNPAHVASASAASADAPPPPAKELEVMPASSRLIPLELTDPSEPEGQEIGGVASSDTPFTQHGAVKTYPFPVSWNAHSRAKFHGAMNRRNVSHELVCPICWRAVVEAKDGSLRKTVCKVPSTVGALWLKTKKRYRWVGHKTCSGTPWVRDLIGGNELSNGAGAKS